MSRLRRVADPSASPLSIAFVDPSAVGPGTYVLAVPGEAIGVDGRITDATLPPAALRGVDASSTGAAVVVDEDSQHRPARVGGRVTAAEAVEGAPIVVRVSRPAPVPWLRSVAGLAGTVGSAPGVLAVAVVVLLALVGAGIGGYDLAGSEAGENGEPEAATLTERTPTSAPTPTAPPSVTATPPEPTVDTPPATATPTREADGRITVSVADPADVRQRDGLPTTVAAALSGSVELDSRADAAVVVVQSWVPGHGWAEVARATTTAERLSLADRFGEVVLASGDRAAGFDNPRDGTTVEHRGRVSVTAVLFDGEREIGRLSATDGYTLRVTNLPAPRGDLVLGDGVATGALFGPDGLRSGDDGTGAESGVVAPGSSGRNTVAVENRGSVAGTLTLSEATVVSFENGRTGPESAVDATGGDPGRGAGELGERLELRLAIERADGSRSWVFGDGSSFRPIDALADGPHDLGGLAAGERVELVVEYRLPASVGNEVQTDSVVVDVSVTLSSAAD